MSDRVGGAGWIVTQSMALELDIALGIVSGKKPVFMSQMAIDLLEAVPADWQVDWAAMMGEPRAFPDVLTAAALLAGTIAERDYHRATLPIRDLTIAAALEAVIQQAEPYGLLPDPDLPPAEQIGDLNVGLFTHLMAGVGFDISERAPSLRIEQQAMVRILRDGDLHTRFWHWLDRFYYECYRPVRDTYIELTDRYEQQAITMLGEREHDHAVPDLSWLGPHNPLQTHPSLREAVEAEQLRVMFISTPFEMADLWGLQPGLLITSFADEDGVFEQYQAVVEDLASRVKAVSDPTRLIILRLIRHFGLTNTEIAAFVGVSRPTISEHVRILQEAGLVHSQKEGRTTKHQIDNAALWALLDDLQDMLDPTPRGDL